MFGKMIKDYMTYAGLKNNAVAQRAGIPSNTFSIMINEKRKITVEEFAAICEALGVPTEYFFALERESRKGK